MDMLNNKLSIKNLLFTKAVPNYVIPVPVEGHKIYPCTDCGDKFIFESSFNDHVNRKSVKISYMCRHCNRMKVFYNRCNLLYHIRSHVFKTATINVTDLKVEPLPLSTFKVNLTKPSSTSSDLSAAFQKASTTNAVFCFECKLNVTHTGIAYKDRVSHFMQYTNQVFSCPICLFALPSICGLKTHLRIHLKCPPYYCPECGVHLTNKNINYPYNHDCEGFKMMRATARLNCTAPDCRLFHPNDYKDHMKEFHMKRVYKCPYCVVACFNEVTMQRHLKGHNTETKALLFYQCELCPGKFVMQSHLENHLKGHMTASVFPCWPCGSTFKEISSLLFHFNRKHNKNELINVALSNILQEYEMYSSKPKRIYRVVKRCDQCRRSFTYKCKYEEIHILPNECPYKCTSTMLLDVMPDGSHTTNTQITCHLCKSKISQDWNEIKKHYAAQHKKYKCLDAKIVLSRTDISKYKSQRKSSSFKTSKQMIGKKLPRKGKKRQHNNPSISSTEVDNIQTEDRHVCKMCGKFYELKVSLEKHMLIHRDPCMAYQCMECGQSFVVKPSFSKHLLLEHNISDTEDYITTKQCFNENALIKYQDSIIISNEPLGENQCKICREEFEGPEDLEKHFRVHGMAFLMKNTSNKTNNIT